MEKFTYIGVLLSTLGIFALIDWRLHLAFFYDKRRTLKTIAAGVGLFIIWDILGIRLDIFYPGNSIYTLNILLGPKFPIEEVFFLISLVYLTLLLWRIGERYVDVPNA